MLSAYLRPQWPRLHPATERVIGDAVGRLLRPEGTRRTGITIAHRQFTIQRADAVLILDARRVAEQGPR